MPHHYIKVKSSSCVNDENGNENLKLKELQSSIYNIEVDDVLSKFSKHIILLPQSDHVRVLQTVIRNKDTPRNEFLFNADCLIRLVVEEGLNQLPYENVCVTTPTGHSYQGISFLRGNCGVSVMRSGEAMERGLRDCCRSMRIGKILIQKAKENDVDAKVYYAKFPPNIENRKVLLMYPILGLINVLTRNPALRIVTSEIHPVVPSHFGQRYFGTF
ncbi:unnamed protein product [Schistosoma intercalatum]|nr:unnamed protein product [Schistosoma intercalatum]